MTGKASGLSLLHRLLAFRFLAWVQIFIETFVQ